MCRQRETCTRLSRWGYYNRVQQKEKYSTFLQYLSHPEKCVILMKKGG
ncbi:hypothetical protein BRYFOR_07065 [Marvinbryantia formatexigens DSM 14469]|uniref:Uncharacterized protein n=1 Tax=Marvinbryantia formatexigens DSM 14469 TaxID=478749 RepID=C6LEL5_9FIRM|nr:hypothetical protein BRYFOR_07065 [Marvinbryantia formatexigens DSM 14469]